MGVAGPHDAFDFTDNDIAVLGNFPLSPRVRTLLLARNRIAAIQTGLPASIPNLKNLVLASNNLTELADLDMLGKFGRLTHLVLADNPVTKKEVCGRFVCGGVAKMLTVGSTTDTGSFGDARQYGFWIM